MAMRAPDNLRREGRKLWRRMTDDVEYDADEVTVLINACRLADEIAELESALADQPRVVTGSQGQAAVHPAVGELRQHRMNMNAMLSQLNYPREGRTRLTRSEIGRDAAAKRWHGKQRGA